jgi:hypothetical protein
MTARSKPAATPSIKVARNDPSLASALTGQALERGASADQRMLLRLTRLNSVAAADKLLRAHFGERLLASTITRATGSRAKAGWTAIDFYENNERGVLSRFTFSGRDGWSATSAPIYVSRHAFARIVQRTLGHSDLARACALLYAHVALAFHAHRCKRTGEFYTVTRDGAVAWKPLATGGFIAATWISRGVVIDRELRKVMDAAGDDCVELRPLTPTPAVPA